MPEQLHEYEVTDKNGIVTTVQMTEEDAKKVPDARKVGARHQAKAEPTNTGAQPKPGEHGQGDVKNRARR